MEIILLERIENLGQMGDVVRVRPGYARNYLLPQKKALRANKDNMVTFQQQRAQLEANNLKRKSEAEDLAVRMGNLSVLIIRQAGEGGQLYGSVTGRDVADAITEAGFKVERRQISLDQPIKTLGAYSLRVGLHPEVGVMVTVAVARSQEEAERQAAAALAAVAVESVEAEAVEAVETVEVIEVSDVKAEA